MSDYIATRLEFDYAEDNNKIIVDGKVYAPDESGEPEYIDDGVLDISYFPIYDEDGEHVDNMVWAFDKLEDAEGSNEWSDEYNADDPYPLYFAR